jgi:hypothetical protein
LETKSLMASAKTYSSCSTTVEAILQITHGPSPRYSIRRQPLDLASAAGLLFLS